MTGEFFTILEECKMFKRIQAFVRDEEGATAIEYALIAGLIAAVLAVTLTGLGTTIVDKLKAICTALGGTCS